MHSSRHRPNSCRVKKCVQDISTAACEPSATELHLPKGQLQSTNRCASQNHLCSLLTGSGPKTTCIISALTLTAKVSQPLYREEPNLAPSRQIFTNSAGLFSSRNSHRIQTQRRQLHLRIIAALLTASGRKWDLWPHQGVDSHRTNNVILESIWYHE